MTWRHLAACRGMDPDIFHPDRGGDSGQAKAICAGCPVREECLEYAVVAGERLGVWGGMAERERRQLRVRPRPTCGTNAGYSGHQWRDEDPCDPCKAAHAEYQRDRRGVPASAARRSPAPHGTIEGYRAHVRRGQPACEPCRTVWAAAWRAGKTEETSERRIPAEVAS